MHNTKPAETSFASLNLDERLLRALDAKGYTAPSPIQAQCIPLLLEGRDILATAQTGTGKTAAFALPILQLLLRHPRRMPRNTVRALILTPTRELAAQIHKSFLDYGANTHAHCAVIYGGVGFPAQIRTLQRGVDVLVATPGRLEDLRERGCIDLGEVAVFVLDEADRMLDMGFQPAVRRIAAELPEVRQSLLFSATMPANVRTLAEKLLNDDPARVSVAQESATADNIAQEFWPVEGAHKKDLLLHILRETQPEGLVMVFTRMKHVAGRLAQFLEKNGVPAEAIHGNKSQNARERALAAFRSGEVRVLAATDVASRGIDIKDVALVINYDMPAEAEAYVHRIGRTARAGASGKAIAFVSRDDHSLARSVERLIKQTIPVHDEHPFAPKKHASAAAETTAAEGAHGRSHGSHGSSRGHSSAGGGGGNGGRVGHAFRQRAAANRSRLHR
ncbi:MAG: DEAD/DEAH box helicase [Puniceicoccales bacterium]|jgi:ATP-dependent RNA helicase RhlE|nr:DEAD/DEAH box helicase [Puniceicoccales bacterium]